MNTPEEDPVFALQMSQTKAQFLGWAGAFPELKKAPLISTWKKGMKQLHHGQQLNECIKKEKYVGNLI